MTCVVVFSWAADSDDDSSEEEEEAKQIVKPKKQKESGKAKPQEECKLRLTLSPEHCTSFNCLSS